MILHIKSSPPKKKNKNLRPSVAKIEALWPLGKTPHWAIAVDLRPHTAHCYGGPNFWKLYSKAFLQWYKQIGTLKVTPIIGVIIISILQSKETKSEQKVIHYCITLETTSHVFFIFIFFISFQCLCRPAFLLKSWALHVAHLRFSLRKIMEKAPMFFAGKFSAKNKKQPDTLYWYILVV